MSSTNYNEQKRDKSANRSFEPPTPSRHHGLQEPGERETQANKKMNNSKSFDKIKEKKDGLKGSLQNNELNNKSRLPNSMDTHLSPTILPDTSQRKEMPKSKDSQSVANKNTLAPSYPTETSPQKRWVSNNRSSPPKGKNIELPTILPTLVSPKRKEKSNNKTVHSQGTKNDLPPKDNPLSPEAVQSTKERQMKIKKNSMPKSFPSEKSPPFNAKQSKDRKDQATKEKGRLSPSFPTSTSPKLKQTHKNSERKSKNMEASLSTAKEIITGPKTDAKDQRPKPTVKKLSILEKVQRENIQAASGFITAEPSKKDEQVKKIQELARSIFDKSKAENAIISKSSTSVTDIEQIPQNRKQTTSNKVANRTSNEPLKSRSVSEPRKKKTVTDNKIKEPSVNLSMKEDLPTNALENGEKPLQSSPSPQQENTNKVNKEKSPKIEFQNDSSVKTVQSDHRIKKLATVSSSENLCGGAMASSDKTKIIHTDSSREQSRPTETKSPKMQSPHSSPKRIEKSDKCHEQQSSATCLEMARPNKSSSPATPDISVNDSPVAKELFTGKVKKIPRQDETAAKQMSNKCKSSKRLDIAEKKMEPKDKRPEINSPLSSTSLGRLHQAGSKEEHSPRKEPNKKKWSPKNSPVKHRIDQNKIKSNQKEGNSKSSDELTLLSTSKSLLLDEGILSSPENQQSPPSSKTRINSESVPEPKSSKDVTETQACLSSGRNDETTNHDIPKQVTAIDTLGPPCHSHGDSEPHITNSANLIDNFKMDRKKPVVHLSHFQNGCVIAGDLEQYDDMQLSISGDSDLKPTVSRSTVGCNDYSSYRLERQIACTLLDFSSQKSPPSSNRPSKSLSQVSVQNSPNRKKDGSAQPISIRVVGSIENTKLGKEKDCKKKKKKKNDNCLKPSKSRSTTSCYKRCDEGTSKKRRSRSEESVVCEKQEKKQEKPSRCTPRCDDRCCPGRNDGEGAGRGGGGGGRDSGGRGNRGRGGIGGSGRTFENVNGWFGRISSAVGGQLQYLAGNRGRFIQPQRFGFYRPDNTTTGWICPEEVSCSESTTTCLLRKEEKLRKARKRDDDDTDSQVDTMTPDESGQDEDHSRQAKTSKKDTKREAKGKRDSNGKRESNGKRSSDGGRKRSSIKSIQDAKESVEKLEEIRRSSLQNKKTVSQSVQTSNQTLDRESIKGIRRPSAEMISKTSIRGSRSSGIKILHDMNEEEVGEVEVGEEESDDQGRASIRVTQQTERDSLKSSNRSSKQTEEDRRQSSVVSWQQTEDDLRKSSIQSENEIEQESRRPSIQSSHGKERSSRNTSDQNYQLLDSGSGKTTIQSKHETERDSRRQSIRSTREISEDSQRQSFQNIPEVESSSRKSSTRSVQEKEQISRSSSANVQELGDDSRSQSAQETEVYSRGPSVQSVQDGEDSSRKQSTRGSRDTTGESRKTSTKSTEYIDDESSKPSSKGPQDIVSGSGKQSTASSRDNIAESRKSSTRSLQDMADESDKPSSRYTQDIVSGLRKESIASSHDNISVSRKSSTGGTQNLDDESRKPSTRSTQDIESGSRKASTRSTRDIDNESQRTDRRSTRNTESEERKSSILSGHEKLEEVYDQSASDSREELLSKKSTDTVYDGSEELKLTKRSSSKKSEGHESQKSRTKDSEMIHENGLASPDRRMFDSTSVCSPECSLSLAKLSKYSSLVSQPCSAEFHGDAAPGCCKKTSAGESPRHLYSNILNDVADRDFRASDRQSHETTISGSHTSYRQEVTKQSNTTNLSGSFKRSIHTLSPESIKQSYNTIPGGSIEQSCGSCQSGSIRKSHGSIQESSMKQSYGTYPSGSVKQSYGTIYDGSMTKSCGSCQSGSIKQPYGSIHEGSMKQSCGSCKSGSIKLSYGSIQESSMKQSYGTYPSGSVKQSYGSIQESSINQPYDTYPPVKQSYGSIHDGSMKQSCGSCQSGSVKQSYGSIQESSMKQSYGTYPSGSVKQTYGIIHEGSMKQSHGSYPPGSVKQSYGSIPQEPFKESCRGSPPCFFNQSYGENFRGSIKARSPSDHDVILRSKSSRGSGYLREFKSERSASSRPLGRKCYESPLSSPCSTVDHRVSSEYRKPQSFLNSTSGGESQMSSPPRIHGICNKEQEHKSAHVNGFSTALPCNSRKSRLQKSSQSHFRHRSAEHSTSRSVQDDVLSPRKSHYLQRVEQNRISGIPKCHGFSPADFDECKWIEDMLVKCKAGNMQYTRTPSATRRTYPKSYVSQSKQSRLSGNYPDAERVITRGRRTSPRYYKRSASFSKYSSRCSNAGESDRSRSKQLSTKSDHSARWKPEKSSNESGSTTATDCIEGSNVLYSRLSTDESQTQEQTATKSCDGHQREEREIASETTITGHDNEDSCTVSCESEGSETTEIDRSEYDSHGGYSSDCCDAGDTGFHEPPPKLRGRIILKKPDKLRNTEICFQNMKIKMECRSHDDYPQEPSHRDFVSRRCEARDRTSNRRKHPESDSDKGTSFSQPIYIPDRMHCINPHHESMLGMKEGRNLTMSQKMIDLPSETESGKLVSGLGKIEFPEKYQDHMRMRLLPEQKIDQFQQIITPEQPISIRTGESQKSPTGYFDDNEVYVKNVVGTGHHFYSSDIATSMTTSQVQAEFDEIHNFGKTLFDEDMIYKRKTDRQINASVQSKENSSLFDTDFDDITSDQSIIFWPKDKNASASGNNNQSSLTNQEECDQGQTCYSNGIKEAIKTFNANLLSLSKNEPMTETVDLDHIRLIPNIVQPQHKEMFSIGDFIDPSEATKDDPKIVCEKIRENSYRALMYASTMAKIPPFKTFRLSSADFTSNEESIDSTSLCLNEDFEDKSADSISLIPNKHDVGTQVNLPKDFSHLKITACELHSYDAQRDKLYSPNSSTETGNFENGVKSEDKDSDVLSLASNLINSVVQSKYQDRYFKRLREFEKNSRKTSLFSNEDLDYLRFDKLEKERNELYNDDYTLDSQSTSDSTDFKHLQHNSSDFPFDKKLFVNNESFHDPFLSPADYSFAGNTDSLGKDVECVSSRSYTSYFVNHELDFDLCNEQVQAEQAADIEMLNGSDHSSFCSHMDDIAKTEYTYCPLKEKTYRRKKSRLSLKHKPKDEISFPDENSFNPSQFVKECLEKEIEYAIEKVYYETYNTMSSNIFECGINYASSNNVNQSPIVDCSQAKPENNDWCKGIDNEEESWNEESLLNWVKAKLRQEIGKLVSRFDWSAISKECENVRKSSLKGSSVDFCNTGPFSSQCCKIQFKGISCSSDSCGCLSSQEIPCKDIIQDRNLSHINKTNPSNCKRCQDCNQKPKGACQQTCLQKNEHSKVECRHSSDVDNGPYYETTEPKKDQYQVPDCNRSYTYFSRDLEKKCCGSAQENGLSKVCPPRSISNCGYNAGNKRKESSVDFFPTWSEKKHQNIECFRSSNLESRYDKWLKPQDESARCTYRKSRSQTFLNAISSDTNVLSPTYCHSAGSLAAAANLSMRYKPRRCGPACSEGDKRNFREARNGYIPFLSNEYRTFNKLGVANITGHIPVTKSSSAIHQSKDYKSSFMRSKNPPINAWKTKIYDSLAYMNDPADAFVRMYLSMESRSRNCREGHHVSDMTSTIDKNITYGARAANLFLKSLNRINIDKHAMSSDSYVKPLDTVSRDWGKLLRASHVDTNPNIHLNCANDQTSKPAKYDILYNRWIKSLHNEKNKSRPSHTGRYGLSHSFTNRNWNQNANNGSYDSPPNESLSNSSDESDDGMIVDKVPFVNMCLSDVASHRGINRSEAVLDLPSLCGSELINNPRERGSFLSNLKHWKNREKKYSEPHSEPIYQTSHFRNKNEFSVCARKNLNSSGNVMHTLSRGDLVKEEIDDNFDGSEEDYHSAEEDMTPFPPRSSEVDAQDTRYLNPHRMADMCNHRHCSLADDCSRMQLHDLCRNCSCLLKYCQGMKRELKLQYSKIISNNLNNTTEAMCFSNNRSEQEDRNIPFPFYTKLSEKGRGQPKIFKIGGGGNEKHMPNTIKDFMNWYASDDEVEDLNAVQYVGGNEQNMAQFRCLNKSEKNENCTDANNTNKVSPSIKEDPTAHGDVQTTKIKNKNVISNCEGKSELQHINALDASSSSYEDTDDDDEHDLTSIENLGYRMLKGLVDSKFHGERNKGAKESKTRHSYRETLQRSRAPFKRKVSKLKRSRAISRFINDATSIAKDKAHRLYHRDESRGDVSDSTSLEDIQVPQVDKGRVRFACDKNGEWAEVGRGSYGCVYLGLLDSEIEVAIKDFYESNSYDHVIHEARMLLFLQGTGITPKFYGLRRRFDATKQPGEYCIIMEYFGDGKTLFNVLSEKIELTTVEWLDVLGQLVAGLRLIHRRNVLINDLKADNILIDLNSARKTIRYIDVGMATYKQGLTFQLPQNQMGKYNFLAPEVRYGLHTSKRSDIYSLGYMLDQIRRVAGSALNGLEGLVNQCMREDPRKRPYIDEIVSKVHRFVQTTHVTRPIPTRTCIPMSNSV